MKLRTMVIAREYALCAGPARRGQKDLPLRDIRERGLLGRSAPAAQGHRRREERRHQPRRLAETALSVGLKVDADALPAALRQQLKAGKINLDDQATTIFLLKLNAIVGVTAFATAWAYHA